MIWNDFLKHKVNYCSRSLPVAVTESLDAFELFSPVTTVQSGREAQEKLVARANERRRERDVFATQSGKGENFGAFFWGQLLEVRGLVSPLLGLKVMIRNNFDVE